MRAKHIFGVTTSLLTLLLVVLASINFNPPAVFARDIDTASIATRQSAAHMQADGDNSEIGSTDGILVMGVVIVLIVTLPLVFRRSK